MPPQACPAGYAARAFIRAVGDNHRKKNAQQKKQKIMGIPSRVLLAIFCLCGK
jgi:hypothetical protein